MEKKRSESSSGTVGAPQGFDEVNNWEDSNGFVGESKTADSTSSIFNLPGMTCESVDNFV